jgi:hypothetical protein
MRQEDGWKPRLPTDDADDTGYAQIAFVKSCVGKRLAPLRGSSLPERGIGNDQHIAALPQLFRQQENIPPLHPYLTYDRADERNRAKLLFFAFFLNVSLLTWYTGGYFICSWRTIMARSIFRKNADGEKARMTGDFVGWGKIATPLSKPKKSPHPSGRGFRGF